MRLTVKFCILIKCGIDDNFHWQYNVKLTSEDEYKIICNNCK